ncbi:MAG: outer membrane beta-barrel protein [Gallionella sp.]|nr:outer membrane beta-barrel protein [Gallionella sp.]
MKKIAIVALLSAFAAAPALAENYIGVNVGSAKIDLSGASNTSSFALLGGFGVNENVAIEVAYTSFGKDNAANGSIKSKGVSFSGVGSYPINEQFSVFGKLGFASTTVDVTVLTGPFAGSGSSSKTGLTYGFGAQFNVNKQVGIRAGYDSYKIGDSSSSSDQNVMSIGGIFKF